MRKTLLLLGLALVPWALSAADSSTRHSRRPLDLPAGLSSTTEDEEDHPETILFYGSEFEADGFFFCFPAFDF